MKLLLFARQADHLHNYIDLVTFDCGLRQKANWPHLGLTQLDLISPAEVSVDGEYCLVPFLHHHTPSHDERFFKYTLEITVQGLRIIDDN